MNRNFCKINGDSFNTFNKKLYFDMLLTLNERYDDQSTNLIFNQISSIPYELSIQQRNVIFNNEKKIKELWVYL